MEQNWSEQLNERIKRLIDTAHRLKNDNTELRRQLQQTQEQPVQENPTEQSISSTEWDELKQRCEKLETKLVQAEERFRIEYSLLEQQYNSNIAKLNQALAQQMQAVRSQHQSPAKTADHSETERLRAENSELRRQIQQSANNAQNLADQLARIAGEQK